MTHSVNRVTKLRYYYFGTRGRREKLILFYRFGVSGNAIYVGGAFVLPLFIVLG